MGESNYFRDEFENVTPFKNSEEWYLGDHKDLIPKEMHIAVSNWVGGYSTFNNLFKSLRCVLKEAAVDGYNDEYLLEETAFYNYFLRPASKKGSNFSFKKDCQSIDKKVAGTALSGIIDLYKPDLVIFVSKYAWLGFNTFIKSEAKSFEAIIDFVYHPSRPVSWHHKNGCGQRKFERLLKEYWLL